MDIELTRTITVLEFLWVVVNFGGAYYGLTNWWDARLTVRAARTPPVDNVAVILADIMVFIQFSITLVQTGYGVMGLLSWLAPVNPDTASIAHTITVLGFIGLSALLALTSYRVKTMRQKAIALLENGNAHHS